jgi:polyhydroxyalkanoate synthase subunit PhaC
MRQTAKRLLNLARAPFLGSVAPTPADVVFEENKWRLLRYRGPPPKYATPVLLVPSLINRHYVLDLAKGRSFAAWLVEQGHAVYIIDWGTPGPEDRFLSLDEIIAGYLGRAIRRVAKSTPRGQAHVLGYCLGGTLAAIEAAHRPEPVASFTALAAPVAFAEAGLLALWSRTRSFDVEALVQATGNVPWPLMQAAFHMLRPTLSLSKLVHAVDRAWDDEFLQGFVALERWGNDNVSFPGVAYAEYIQRLYRDDGLMRRTFALAGERIDLGNLRAPTLVVTFKHDTIVPEASAVPLYDRAGAADKLHLSLSGGHVGAVVARKASESLWPQLSRFWAERDAAKPAKRHRTAS